MNRTRSALLIALLFYNTAPCAEIESEFRLGYRYDLLLASVDAAAIDPSFPEVDRGHTSAFYLGKKISDIAFWQFNVGAWNSALKDNAEFSYQYSMIELGVKGDRPLFLVAGAGIGAAIAALTVGTPEIGKVQTGKILRDTMFVVAPMVGVGYRFSNTVSPLKLELIFELRQLKYYSALNEQNLFSKLNSNVGGISISRKL